MGKINKIKISGTSYDIEDINASKTVELTQAEYNALVSGGTVDPNTFYVITDATSIDLSQYYTSAQTNDAIASAVSGKADTTAVTTVNNTLTAHTADTSIHVTSSDKTTWSGKQDALVSGTNIKTINNQSLLGSGNITIEGGGGGTSSAVTTSVTSASTDTEIPTAKAVYDAIPTGGTSSAVTTSVTSASTDSEIPTAKAVYDAIPTGSTSSVDQTIISGSTNAVAGGAVYAKFDDVQNSLSGYMATSAVSTSVTSASTDSEIPTAKAVFDAIPTGGTGASYTAGRGIDIDTANTISLNLAIFSGTNSDHSGLKFNYSGNTSSGQLSSAFGISTNAIGRASMAIGSGTYARGSGSFAGGNDNSQAYGNPSFAFGGYIEARGNYTQAFGIYINTTKNYETAFGNSNVSNNGSTNADKTHFSIGNGINNNNRHNAFDVRLNGDIYIADTNDTSTDNYYQKPTIKLQDYLKFKIVKLTQTEYTNLQVKDENTLYVIIADPT